MFHILPICSQNTKGHIIHGKYFIFQFPNYAWSVSVLSGDAQACDPRDGSGQCLLSVLESWPPEERR